MKIVADDKIPFLKGVLEPFAEIDYLPGDQINPTSLKNTDALITRSITHCNADLLKESPLKLIATATIGDDHIDKQFCQEHNIAWTSAKGCNAGAVEQYVTAALLEMANRQKIELEGKAIGIVGVGEIGSRVARVANLLRMRMLLNDPPRARNEGTTGFSDLKEIQQTADFITFHVPLTFGGPDKTFHFFNEDFFEGLAKPVTLINTSRGAVVETQVLKNAVKYEKISNLVIDVWENEPEIDGELLEMAQIATPHIAGYSIEGKANATAMVVQAVSHFFGLGLDDWYPAVSHEQRDFELDCKGMSEQNVLRMVMKTVYPIHLDDFKLKSTPDHFEEIRRGYVFRRENKAYALRLKNANKKTISTLISLGFQINQ
jgi:erythronate-4-phosphate dehydrogenase